MGVFQLQRARMSVGRAHPEQAETLGVRHLAQHLGLGALELRAAWGAQRKVFERGLAACQVILEHEPRREGATHAGVIGVARQTE